MSNKHLWKERMDGHVPPPVVELERPIPSKWWRRKYRCKKNKGDHSWVFKNIHGLLSSWSFSIGSNPTVDGKYLTWVAHWECSGCHKLASEWNRPEKKFDPYRHTIYQDL